MTLLISSDMILNLGCGLEGLGHKGSEEIHTTRDLVENKQQRVFGKRLRIWKDIKSWYCLLCSNFTTTFN